MHGTEAPKSALSEAPTLPASRGPRGCSRSAGSVPRPSHGPVLLLGRDGRDPPSAPGRGTGPLPRRDTHPPGWLSLLMLTAEAAPDRRSRGAFTDEASWAALASGAARVEDARVGSESALFRLCLRAAGEEGDWK